jgi:hypothetical protein
MVRIRITALPKPDPSEELRRLAMLRRDLYVRSPVEIDPDNPAHRTQRDEQHRAYFDFLRISLEKFSACYLITGTNSM